MEKLSLTTPVQLVYSDLNSDIASDSDFIDHDSTPLINRTAKFRIKTNEFTATCCFMQRVHHKFIGLTVRSAGGFTMQSSCDSQPVNVLFLKVTQSDIIVINRNKMNWEETVSSVLHGMKKSSILRVNMCINQ